MKTNVLFMNVVMDNYDILYTKIYRIKINQLQLCTITWMNCTKLRKEHQRKMEINLI